MPRIKLDNPLRNYLLSKTNMIAEYTSGIYFLTLNNSIIYIGQSINIKTRIGGHISNRLKPFDDVFFIGYSLDMLADMEMYHIFKHNPPLNRKHGVIGYKPSIVEYCNNNNISLTNEPGDGNAYQQNINVHGEYGYSKLGMVKKQEGK